MELTKPIQILELFGGIGSPRVALRNLGIPVKSIDYVEIDAACVRSYNAMFEMDHIYLPQTVVGWNLRPDILIHGSPCVDISIAGHQGKAKAEDGRVNRGAGAEEGSGTRSSLMWQTVHIIEAMGEWKPKIVVWENVTNLTSVHMVNAHRKYQASMEKLGYTNSWAQLDARDFGLPQGRQRVFTVSVLNGPAFDFSKMELQPMRNLAWFLESTVGEQYIVTQPTVLRGIGKGKGDIRRAEIINELGFARTITTRPDRTPTQVIDLGNGQYRYLTELECWRLQGYSDAEFYAAERACPGKPGKLNRTLYKQAGNSIPVPIFESMFDAMFAEGYLAA